MVSMYPNNMVALLTDLRSAPINVEDIGLVHFRLTEPTSGRVRLMSAEVKLGGSTIFVVISHAEGDWPFAVENDSDYAFTFYQTASRDIDSRVKFL